MTVDNGTKESTGVGQLRSKLRTLNWRLVTALLAYLVLGIVAYFTLDGFFLWVVLLLFVLLAGKTIAHSKDDD